MTAAALSRIRTGAARRRPACPAPGGRQATAISSALTDALADGTDTAIATLEATAAAQAGALVSIAAFEAARITADGTEGTPADEARARAALVEARAKCRALAQRGIPIDGCSLPQSYSRPVEG